jgi:hypothetical protein
LNGETWTIYFTPWPSGKLWYGFTGDILVATAPSPSGPWTVAAEPALTESIAPAWDSGARYFFTVTRTKDGYSMFYGAGIKAGMATSSDGVRWTRYNDPTTTSDRYAASDPVFEPSQDSKAWDRDTITQTVVRLTDKGWEMFYDGAHQGLNMSIGYATSPDGIKWTRLGDAPLLTDPNNLLYPEAVVEVNGKHYLYYVVVPPTFDQAGVGIAVATITYQ